MLTTYCYVVILLVVVVCVIDYSEKSDAFIKSGLPFSFIFTQYFLNFAPYMANILSPLIVFITTVFVTAKLAAHTEIIAMLSSGISFWRILRPYFISSSCISIIIFFMIGWIIPNANKKRFDFEEKYLRGTYYFDKRNVHFKVAQDVYVYMESYNNHNKTGYQFTMERIENGKLICKLKSPYVTWKDDIQKWHIPNYILHCFDSIQEQLEFGGSIDTVFSLTPVDFENNHMRHETYTFDELKDRIALLKLRGVENIEIYYVELQERYAYPFAIIILTIIGVIVSARKVRGGAGLQIALGFVLAFIYIMFVMLGRSIAGKGVISPQLSAWMPNIIFTLIGAYMYVRLPK